MKKGPTIWNQNRMILQMQIVLIYLGHLQVFRFQDYHQACTLANHSKHHKKFHQILECLLLL
nr:MAG TPA: hypothetical protein [Crassvirales sp.]